MASGGDGAPGTGTAFQILFLNAANRLSNTSVNLCDLEPMHLTTRMYHESWYQN